LNLYALGLTASVPTTSPVTYHGAFVGGPIGGTGFTAFTPNPCVYLSQESIIPSPVNYAKSFTSGKDVGITSISPNVPATAASVPTSFSVNTLSTANYYGGSGATSADNGTVVIPAGNGYLLYYVHDNTSTSTTSALTDATTTGSGYINQGTILFYTWGVYGTGSITSSLTNNAVSPVTNPHAFAGLTLVGNPYPSTIDLQQVYRDNTGAIFTNGTIGYFNELDPTTTQFGTYGYDGSMFYTSGSNPSQYVASGEGFYVTVVNANKTLTFKEDQKTSHVLTVIPESLPLSPTTNTTDNTVHPSVIASAVAALHLKLVKDSSTYDECGLYFNKKWSDNFDQNDAIDMDGTYAQAYLSSYSADNVRTSINTLSDYTSGKQVKLYARFNTSGIYQLQLSDISNFDTENYSVFLIDNLLKDSLDLTLYKSYNFNYTPGTAK
jgi:hypothetical protein